MDKHDAVKTSAKTTETPTNNCNADLPEKGYLSGKHIASMLVAAHKQKPRVRVIQSQIEDAAEAIFRGIQTEVESLRKGGASEPELAEFVQSLIIGFKQNGGLKDHLLVRISAIASQHWLNRLVPTVSDDGGPRIEMLERKKRKAA